VNQETIKLRVSDVVALANTKFDVELSMPIVDFFDRGTVAGKAYRGINKVTFNTVLAKENPTLFDNTIIHEVAHLVVHKAYPFAKAHGPEFKYVMRVLGGNGKRCHSYNVESVKVTKQYTRCVAKCDCQEHLVTPRTARVIHRYTCKKCKSKIVLTGKTRAVIK